MIIIIIKFDGFTVELFHISLNDDGGRKHNPVYIYKIHMSNSRNINTKLAQQ